MCVLFAVLSAALLLTLIWQRIQYKKLLREINYISNRLETLSITSENGFVLLPTDCTCMKKLGAVLNTLLQDFYTSKAEFEQTQKAMAQFLTNISHDIRTPLTVLKGNSEMLAAKADELSVLENIHTMAVKIDRKADDLITTINDYFTMSKIASGDLPLKLQKENISRLCHDTILEYYDLLEKQQFEVDLQIPDTPIFAYTDRDALQRILKNLIDNAIRYGSDGQYLSLRLNAVKEKSVVEIEDHGKGMSPQQQKQIFTRNYTTAPKSSGSGLGLAISKHLASQIGAELRVQSIPNEQTVFSIIMKS
ncbi:HAMP domain-containing sensor histidine kinase [Roseburia hominis]